MAKSTSNNAEGGGGAAKKARGDKKAAKVDAKPPKKSKRVEAEAEPVAAAPAADGEAHQRRRGGGPNPRKLLKRTLETQRQHALLLRRAPFVRLARSYVKGEDMRFSGAALTLMQAAVEQRTVALLRNASDMQAATKAGVRASGPALDVYVKATTVSAF